MNLMHSSTASLLWDSSATTRVAECRMLLLLAGVHSREREAALEGPFFVGADDQNAMATLTLARR